MRGLVANFHLECVPKVHFNAEAQKEDESSAEGTTEKPSALLSLLCASALENDCFHPGKDFRYTL